MTRTQAWRKVAEAYGTPPEKRTKHQASFTWSGLALAVWRVANLGYGPYAELRELERAWGLEVNTLTHHGDDPTRAGFAALMAAMTQRERDRLVKGL